MNECPECGGLLIEDYDDDSYSVPLYCCLHCPGCGWSSEDIDELDDDDQVMSYDPDDNDDFPRYDDDDEAFDRCAQCDGHDACADFGCAIQAGLGHMVS